MPDEGTGDFDVAGATAAIEAGGGLGQMMSEEMGVSTPSTPTPTEQQGTPTPQEGQSQESATPAHWTQQQRDEYGRWQAAQARAQQEAQTAQEDTGFTNVDPNTLPPEVQPVYKSLQADYTKKMQAIAEQRRQIEQYGDPATLQQATELYTALQNPQNWPAIHRELTQNLQAMGYSVSEAQAEAARQIEGAATAQPSGLPGDWAEDPELAPVKSYVEKLEQRLNGFEQEFNQRKQQEQQEQLQMALVGELQRQENLIRQSNPHYTDQDVDAVYELSSYYGGNLLQAQQRYESLWQDRLTRYVSDKGMAVEMGGVALPGAGTTTQKVEQVAPARDFEGAHAGVMDALRSIDAL